MPIKCKRIPSSENRKFVLIFTKEKDERNKIISRFLEKEFIWTVSDRSEDQREVDSERVSEATFCKILLLSKHIKTDGKRKL